MNLNKAAALYPIVKQEDPGIVRIRISISVPFLMKLVTSVSNRDGFKNMLKS